MSDATRHCRIVAGAGGGVEIQGGIPRTGSLTLPGGSRNVRHTPRFPMMTLFMNGSLTILSLFSPAVLAATDAPAASWHTQSILGAVGCMALFGAGGIVLAIAGYKIFDKCAPNDTRRHIIEH